MPRSTPDTTRRSLFGVAGAVAAGLPAPASAASGAVNAGFAFVGLFNALGATTIPLGTDVIMTGGYHTTGKGAARYVLDADQASAAAHPWRARSLNNRWFILSETWPNQYQLGAVGDGKADDTAALQALADFALYIAHLPAIFIAGGRHRTTDTWHIGYGVSYTALAVDGAGSGYLGDIGGAAIIPTKYDRPCIAVQGARVTRIRGLALVGPLHTQLVDLGLASASPKVNPRDLANWTGGHPNGAYNVFCGIAIDPYSGDDPAAKGYPAVTFPSFLGGAPQYGKNFSSDVLIEDCDIVGFVAGVAVQPCPADGNGDFVRLRDTRIEYCAYGVSVGNTQSRLVKLDYVNFVCGFVAITNTAHGHGPAVGQAGKLTSEVNACQFQHVANWFDLRMDLAGPMVFRSCFSESGWRLGDATGPSRVAAILFEGCEFGFHYGAPDAWGVPDNELWLANAGQAVFSGCSFKRFWSVFNVHGGEVVVASSDVWTCAQGRKLPYEKIAHNSSIGGFVHAASDNGVPTRSTRVDSLKPDIVYDLDTWASAFGSAPPVRKAADTASVRRVGQHLYQESFIQGVGGLPQPVTRTRGRLYGASSLQDLSLNGTRLAFRYPKTDDPASAFAANIGCLLRFSGNSAWFFVDGYIDNGDGTATVTAVLQNNYFLKPDRSVGYIAPFTFTGGYFISYTAAQFYNIEAALFADASPTSRVLANVQRGDGAAFYSSVKVGDSILVDPAQDSLFHAGAKITALKPFTLSGAPSRAQLRAPLTTFVRPAFS